MTDLVLVPVGRGALALTHRPKRVVLSEWKAAGATHVVTLLGEREQARDIGDAAIRAGLIWIWVPMPGAAIPDEAGTLALLPAIDNVARAVADGGRVVIHCSAGIHRTGMFGYAVLRRLGLAANEARDKLPELRAVTAAGVGEDRLQWADRAAAISPRPESEVT